MKTPTPSQFYGAAMLAGSGIAAAKLSDGLAAITPIESVPIKKFLFALTGVAIAVVGANVKGIAGNGITGAGLGIAIKQGSDWATEMINPSIAPKDNSKLSGKFINAIAGHSTVDTGVTKRALNSPWVEYEPAYEVESIVDYNDNQELPSGLFV